jgi:hypothetical protein
MRSTFDLPENLVKRAKIAALKRGTTQSLDQCMAGSLGAIT